MPAKMRAHNASASSLAIKIGKLWSGAEGNTEKFHVDVPVSFTGGEIKPSSNFEADILLVKLKNEISAIIKDATIVVHFICERCLKEYDYTIEFTDIGREFLREKNKDLDPNEFFLINFETMTIDLHEMVRQEIILHFPFITLCSKGCKGLCPKCGANRNKKKCGCREEDFSMQKPFKNLKKLIHGKTSSTEI